LLFTIGIMSGLFRLFVLPAVTPNYFCLAGANCPDYQWLYLAFDFASIGLMLSGGTLFVAAPVIHMTSPRLKSTQLSY